MCLHMSALKLHIKYVYKNVQNIKGGYLSYWYYSEDFYTFPDFSLFEVFSPPRTPCLYNINKKKTS